MLHIFVSVRAKFFTDQSLAIILCSVKKNYKTFYHTNTESNYYVSFSH